MFLAKWFSSKWGIPLAKVRIYIVGLFTKTKMKLFLQGQSQELGDIGENFWPSSTFSWETYFWILELMGDKIKRSVFIRKNIFCVFCLIFKNQHKPQLALRKWLTRITQQWTAKQVFIKSKINLLTAQKTKERRQNRVKKCKVLAVRDVETWQVLVTKKWSKIWKFTESVSLFEGQKLMSFKVNKYETRIGAFWY